MSLIANRGSLLTLVIFLACGSPFGQRASKAAHDKAFWRAIAANKYQIPPNEKPFALAEELSSYLGSPDPELRHDLAYL